MCVEERGKDRCAATVAMIGWGIMIVVNVYYLLNILPNPIEGWDLLIAPLALAALAIAVYMLVSIKFGREVVQSR